MIIHGENDAEKEKENDGKETLRLTQWLVGEEKKMKRENEYQTTLT